MDSNKNSSINGYQGGAVIFWILAVLYLKFLVIWRGFSLWAYADGISTPENMRGCIFVPCTIESFWKNWHSSFREWNLKYIYYPMGGNRCSLYRTIFNKVLVFIFVALWHDRNSIMFSWGLILCICVVIEQFSKKFCHEYGGDQY